MMEKINKVWEVKVAKMSKKEAEEYIKNLIKRYKKKIPKEEVTFWSDKEKFL